MFVLCHVSGSLFAKRKTIRHAYHFLLNLNPYSAVVKATRPKMIPGKLAVAKAKSLGFLPRP